MIKCVIIIGRDWLLFRCTGSDGCDGVVVAAGGRAVAFLNDAASIRHAVLPHVRPFRVRLLAVDVPALVAKPARLSAVRLRTVSIVRWVAPPFLAFSFAFAFAFAFAR